MLSAAHNNSRDTFCPLRDHLQWLPSRTVIAAKQITFYLVIFLLLTRCICNLHAWSMDCRIISPRAIQLKFNTTRLSISMQQSIIYSMITTADWHQPVAWTNANTNRISLWKLASEATSPGSSTQTFNNALQQVRIAAYYRTLQINRSQSRKTSLTSVSCLSKGSAPDDKWCLKQSTFQMK